MYDFALVAAEYLPATVSLKLSDDDAFLTWGSLIIPTFAAVASTSVAVVSVLIAKRAKDIAQKSEQARVQAEAVRSQFEQQQRLDAALRDLFLGIAQRAADLMRFEFTVANSRNSWVSTGTSGGPLIPPSDSPLLALVAAARLEAHEDDERRMLAAVHAYILKAGVDAGELGRGISSDARILETQRLERLWFLIDEWRHSDPPDRQEILQELRGIRSEEPMPPRAN